MHGFWEKKLDKVQAKALRICSGAYHTTPILALLIEIDEMEIRSWTEMLGENKKVLVKHF